MPSASERTDFGPPPTQGNIRAFVLALVVHLLLIIALTWGVSWKSQDDAASSFAAELWTNSAVQEAVPRQPTPQPVPVPTPTPPPAPTPAPAPEPKVETPPTPDPDIALAQEKKRKQDEEKRQARELAAKEAAKDKARQEAAAEEADRKARIAKAEKADKAKEDAKKAQQARELQAARDAKEDKAEKDAKAKEDAKKSAVAKAAADKTRQENLKRIQGMAGATGETDGNSNSRATSGGRGTSTTYGAILRAAVRPNIVFTEEIVGNPSAKVEVRLTADGTVISRRLLESSGNKGWDEAALNAITRTGKMPKDVDGRIPDTILIIDMKPRG